MSSATTPPITSVKEVRLYGAGFDWDGYTQLRPQYPREVFDAIFDYHRSGRNVWESVLDVACGPGTGPTLVLAEHFHTLVGYDKNPEQLEFARRQFAGRDTISFKEGAAEDLTTFESESVDMLTCFTSLHWIEATKFLPEAARVLKPGGTLAVATYYPVGSSGNEAVDKILRNLEKESINAALPLSDTNFLSHWLRECGTSHYDNVEIPSELYTNETRLYWNLQAPIYYTQYSDMDKVDRRNPNSVGYQEISTTLESINSTYTQDEVLALLYTLHHYKKADSEEAVRQIWNILGPGATLTMNRPVQMFLARRI